MATQLARCVKNVVRQICGTCSSNHDNNGGNGSSNGGNTGTAVVATAFRKIDDSRRKSMHVFRKSMSDARSVSSPLPEIHARHDRSETRRWISTQSLSNLITASKNLSRVCTYLFFFIAWASMSCLSLCVRCVRVGRGHTCHAIVHCLLVCAASVGLDVFFFHGS